METATSSITEVGASESQHTDESDHHVHFDEKSTKDDFEQDNSIIYQKVDQHTINIHLGFLQISHRYSIELKLQKAVFFTDCNNSDIVLIADDTSIPNVNCKLVEFEGVDDTDHVNLKIEFFAHKEKLLRENMLLVNEKTKEIKKFVFNARVLGRGKGTPMLRNGIHSIAIEDDDESENSDWHAQGKSK